MAVAFSSLTEWFGFFLFVANPLSLCHHKACLISSSDCKNRSLLKRGFGNKANTDYKCYLLVSGNHVVDPFNFLCQVSGIFFLCGTEKDHTRGAAQHWSRAVHIKSLRPTIVRNEVLRCYEEERAIFKSCLYCVANYGTILCAHNSASGALLPVVTAAASFKGS